jgi:IS5 family transposase
MADGIMRKDYRNAKLTEVEHARNKGISKIRYKIEQYFGFLPVGPTARRD